MTTSAHPSFEQAARLYALGALDDPRSLEVEERLVTDPGAYETLLAVSDDLAEDYLDGALSEDDRRRFEAHYLAIPENQDRVRLLRLLRSQADAAPAPRTSGVWATASDAVRRHPHLAAAAILVLATWGAVSTWLVFERQQRNDVAGRVPPSSRPAPAADPPPTPTASAAADAALRERVDAAVRARLSAEGPLASATEPREFRLNAGVNRGGGSLARVAIPADATFVRLRLDAPPAIAAPPYRARIVDAEGEEVYAVQMRRPRTENDSLSLAVPAEHLVRGDYRLVLIGVDQTGAPLTVGSYPFRVTADAAASTSPPRPPR